jgi:hypothetical protein
MARRLVLFAVVLVAAVGALAAAAGAAEETVESRWKDADTHVVLTMGTSDYGPGEIRVSFLVIGSDGKLISAPRARLSLSRGMKEVPFTTGTATLMDTSAPGAKADGDDHTELFAGTVRAPGPGTYTLLAELEGKSVAGIASVIVQKKPQAPAVGDRAPASRTPTLATQPDVKLLTTRTPPDTELLRVSVADALRRKEPFVVAFATPKFCSSRTCGPVVDVVDAARKRFAGTPVRFIHVEIYEGNNPSKGPNRWVREWRLPTEPWLFVVGTDGRVKARIEGGFSLDELTRAITTRLGVKPRSA